MINIKKIMKKAYIKPEVYVNNIESSNLMVGSKSSCTCGCSSADPTHKGCYNCDKCNHDNSDNHNCFEGELY